MSSPPRLPSPLADRIRKSVRAALKSEILQHQGVDTLNLAADRLAEVETLHAPRPWSIVPVSWRHAAIGVAQIEAELAWVALARNALWRPVGSAGLLRLMVALDTFPAEFEAIHHMGLTLNIDEDEHHSVWIGADGDAEEPGWSAPVRPAMGETFADCVRGCRP